MANLILIHLFDLEHLQILLLGDVEGVVAQAFVQLAAQHLQVGIAAQLRKHCLIVDGTGAIEIGNFLADLL